MSVACLAHAAEPSIAYQPLSAELVSVPQNLLNLVHTVEVQKELGLTAENLEDWEKTLRDIDAVWWPARILPVPEQRKAVESQERKLVSEAERLLGPGAVTRLRQVELQSQGVRILARPEIERFVRLEAAQRKKLAEIFSANDQLADSLKPTKAPVDNEKVKAFAQAKADEPKLAMKLLSVSQMDRVRQALGKPLNTAELKRIYPLAPELIDSGYWSGEERVALESLRGHVVLVHFYAFQCHNCVANFGHYKRWDETLRKKGVRLIGIQTPETAAERDPEKVIAAAKKEGFQFPVLIDVENKNWDAWGNTMWPTVYVIDKKGYIRFWWQGELNWQGATVDQKIDAIVDELLQEQE